MQSLDLQYMTMRSYKAFVDRRGDWGGRLVLLCGPGCAQDGTAPAISIASGTTLAVDSDATAMKSALRNGYLDFVVSSLDEALRALKNEIRQKRALSVGLIADVDATLTEMVARGVQPDDLVTFPTFAKPSVNLVSAFDTFLKNMRGESLADEPLKTALWRFGNLYYCAATDTSHLRAVDNAILAALPAEDIARRHWVERVPRYLREARTGGRWIWLRADEVQRLTAQGITAEAR